MGCPVFFRCKDEKEILGLISGCKNEALKCIGGDFEELDASKAEGAGEKHLPEVNVEGNLITVKVGSVAHPMAEEHGIDWIYLETEQGSQLKKLAPNQEPQAQFALAPNDKAVAAFAYCNLHGFWKKEI